MFKTKKYLNNRKVAEAVNRSLSNSVDPLFYLSSFQTLSRKPPVSSQPPGVFLDFFYLRSIIKAKKKHNRSAISCIIK